MKFSYKKYLVVACIALLALGLFAAPGGHVFAQSVPATANLQGSQTAITVPSAFTCSITSLGTCIPYFIFWVASAVSQMAIAIAAWIIQVGLQLSFNVYNSPVIQNGFDVCLSIANLGFVLAIIVIAIATILRSETYGYKKTLWRLVVMAILVNFGLVITAPLISFANGMTTYFMNAIQGGASGVTLFVNNLANSMSPAAADAPPPASNSGCSTATATAGSILTGSIIPPEAIQALCQIAQSNQSPANTFSQSMLAMIFGIIFKLVIAIAFLSIGALLFVRYIWLGLLLILLPLAWLTWIFPKFSHEFGKWWSNFIKWTFFAPAEMFFIWLAMTINGAYLGTVGATGGAAPTNQTPTAALAALIGNSAPLNQFMNNIIILGIMIGGLIAASSITGKAGSFVVEQAKGVSGAITGYAGKQTKKIGRLAYQKSGGNKLTSALQRGAGPLKYIPIVNRGASLAGRGLAKISTNSKMVEDAQKGVPKSRDQVLANLQNSMNTEDTLAHLAQAVKDGYLTAKTKVNRKDAAQWLDENRDVLTRYGQGALLEDANKLFVSNSNYRTAQRAVNANNGQDTKVAVVDEVKDADGKVLFKAGELVSAMELMRVSMKRLVEGMSKEDASKIGANPALFGPEATKDDVGKKEVQERLGAFALYAPLLVSSLLKKMKSPVLRNVEALFQPAITSAIKSESATLDEKIRDTSNINSEAERNKAFQDLNADKVKLASQENFLREVFNKAIASTVFHAADDHPEEGHDDDHGGEKKDKKGGGHAPAPTPPPSSSGGGSAPTPSGGGVARH